MNPAGRIFRFRTGVPVLLLAFLSLSCGIGGSDFAGGGTGGTGISTGAVTGFGSVEVNGVHFRTDNNVAPGFRTEKKVNGVDKSLERDKDVFAEGMVVTVRHGAGDNNAQGIEYRDNLRGPIAVIAFGADNIIEVLGQTVVVENATIFPSLKRNDIVEVSGFVDNAGRIRAAFILPISPSVKEFEVKGFVSGSSPTGFRLGPLPDGSGATVLVSDTSGGPANGTYVQVVTTDREPVGGSITATRIETLAARTEFPDGDAVGLEGLVTTPWTGSGNDHSFEVEGKRVQWGADIEFVGGTQEDTRQANRRVQVQGIENGGVLFATRIVFL